MTGLLDAYLRLLPAVKGNVPQRAVADSAPCILQRRSGNTGTAADRHVENFSAATFPFERCDLHPFILQNTLSFDHLTMSFTSGAQPTFHRRRPIDFSALPDTCWRIARAVSRLQLQLQWKNMPQHAVDKAVDKICEHFSAEHIPIDPGAIQFCLEQEQVRGWFTIYAADLTLIRHWMAAFLQLK